MFEVREAKKKRQAPGRKLAGGIFVRMAKLEVTESSSPLQAEYETDGARFHAGGPGTTSRRALLWHWEGYSGRLCRWPCRIASGTSQHFPQDKTRMRTRLRRLGMAQRWSP